MRKIGINLHAVSGLEAAEYIKLIKELGFESVFEDSKDRKRVMQDAKLVATAGMRYDTLHGPFDHINDMWHEGEDGNAMLDELCAGVDCCTAVGAPILVVHLSSGVTPPPPTDVGRRRFIKLVNYAMNKNIKIAFENQRMLANIAWAFEEFNDAKNVGFCWDTGHECCFAHGRQYMPLFGDRLICTHIHDNDAQFNHDQHRIPFDGKIDFDRVARQLRESGFGGTLMLEVFRSHSVSRYDGISPHEYLIRAANAAKKLRQMVDGK